MRNFMTGGGGIILLMIGHVHAGEVTCPAVTQLHDHTETVEMQDDPEWQSQSPVQELNPAVLPFNDAEFAVQESEEDNQLPARVSITCNHGEMNLTLDYPSAQEPALMPGLDTRCASQPPHIFRRGNADYLSLKF
ncbi:hypothetical protein [Pseudomonas sp. CFII68]|uniref:hypothetical protein n=1 Tax=Pseudomonas sp. CFII68 TaxID=911243 RepID=UPI0005197B40|nr:hypothetical protein [Pseudomonas sp. CFII68]